MEKIPMLRIWMAPKEEVPHNPRGSIGRVGGPWKVPRTVGLTGTGCRMPGNGRWVHPPQTWNLNSWNCLGLELAIIWALDVLNVHTPLKFNMEPENQTLQKEIPIGKTIISRFHVEFQGCKFFDLHTFHTVNGWEIPRENHQGCIEPCK